MRRKEVSKVRKWIKILKTGLAGIESPREGDLT